MSIRRVLLYIQVAPLRAANRSTRQGLTYPQKTRSRKPRGRGVRAIPLANLPLFPSAVFFGLTRVPFGW